MHCEPKSLIIYLVSDGMVIFSVNPNVIWSVKPVGYNNQCKIP